MSKDEVKKDQAGEEVQAQAVRQGGQGAKPAGYYDPKIDEYGKSYGLKAANLVNTDYLAKDFMVGPDGKILQSLGISIEVPAFKPISGVDVFEYLKASGVDITELYQGFTRAYTSQSDYIEYQAKVELGQSAKMPPLGLDAKDALEHIQGKIFGCFNNVDLEKKGQLKTFLQKTGLREFVEQFRGVLEKLLMIRSTGVNEDQAHQALAGSNFSGPSKAELADVIKRIGDVVASYFSEKSLSQRIAVNDATVLQAPSVLPVLAQSMVGEKAQSNGKEKPDLVYSIVIYTDGNGAMRAQIAATHGEGIVNSKLPVDNIAVDKNGNMTILSASGKVQRIAAEYNEKTGKMELVWKDNPRELHNEPALAPEIAPEVIYALHKFASSLEKTYGQRMDMELVFDPASKKVSLVQARAIPDGARAGLEASAVAPEMIAEQRPEFVKAKDVATPDVNKAVLVVDPRQLVFEDTIVIALEKNPDHEKILSNYQTMTQQPDQSAINNRAVIVTQEAPNTSHEAGQFNAYAVPVMQMSKENQDRLKKLLEEKKYFVIDPQHGGVYVVPDALAASVKKELESGKTIAELTEFLTESGFIAKGVYASAAMPQITTIEYDFKSIEQEQNSGKAKLYQGSFKEILGQQTLGDLIILARKNDDSTEAREAAAKLMSIAYGAMQYGAGSPQEPLQPHSILQNLDALSRLKVGAGDNHECEQALGGVMRSLYQASQKGLISKALFNQMMLQGSSLALMIDDANAAQNLDEVKAKQMHMAYLNTLKQFTGAITAGPENGKLVDSFVLELKETKHKMAVQKSVLKILHPETYSDDMLQALKPLDLEKIFKNVAHFRPASFYKLHDKGTLPPAEQKQAETQITQERLDLFYQASKLTNYFINDQQKDQWLKFCLECTKTPEAAKQLNELLYQVLTNNLTTQWANIMFTQTYNEQYESLIAKTQAPAAKSQGASNPEVKDAAGKGELEEVRGAASTAQGPAALDPRSTMAKAEIEHDAALQTLQALTDSFAQLSGKAPGQNMSALEKITAAKKIIATMKAEIPMWAEPGNFEKLYKGQNGFSEQLKAAMKLLEFNPKASPLEQMMIIEARDKLIDVVDLTAKSLQTSGKYEDKDQQAKNFAQLITVDFYQLMKQCVRDGEYDDGEILFGRLDEFIQSPHHNTQTANASQLNLTPGFDVTKVTIDTPGLLSAADKTVYRVSTGQGFYRGFTYLNPTIATLHTLLHQNAVISNNKCFDASSINNLLPGLLKLFDQKMIYTFNKSSKIYSLNGNDLEITYNMPLNNHSAKAIIHYNMAGQKITCSYSIFGDDRQGWEAIPITNMNCFLISEMKIIKNPVYDKNKSMITFEVEIGSVNDITVLGELFSSNASLSFNKGNQNVVGNILKSRLDNEEFWPYLFTLYKDSKLAIGFVDDKTNFRLLQKILSTSQDKNELLKLLMQGGLIGFYLEKHLTEDAINNPVIFNFTKAVFSDFSNAISIVHNVNQKYLSEMVKVFLQLSKSTNPELTSLAQNPFSIFEELLSNPSFENDHLFKFTILKNLIDQNDIKSSSEWLKIAKIDITMLSAKDQELLIDIACTIHKQNKDTELIRMISDANLQPKILKHFITSVLQDKNLLKTIGQNLNEHLKKLDIATQIDLFKTSLLSRDKTIAKELVKIITGDEKGLLDTIKSEPSNLFSLIDQVTELQIEADSRKLLEMLNCEVVKQAISKLPRSIIGNMIIRIPVISDFLNSSEFLNNYENIQCFVREIMQISDKNIFIISMDHIAPILSQIKDKETRNAFSKNLKDLLRQKEDFKKIFIENGYISEIFKAESIPLQIKHDLLEFIINSVEYKIFPESTLYQIFSEKGVSEIVTNLGQLSSTDLANVMIEIYSNPELLEQKKQVFSDVTIAKQHLAVYFVPKEDEHKAAPQIIQSDKILPLAGGAAEVAIGVAEAFPKDAAPPPLKLAGEYSAAPAAADHLEESQASYQRRGSAVDNGPEKAEGADLKEPKSPKSKEELLKEAAALGGALTGKMTEQKATASKERGGALAGSMAEEKIDAGKEQAGATARNGKEHEEQVKEVAKQLAPHLQASSGPEAQGQKEPHAAGGQMQPSSTPSSLKASKESPKSRE